MKSPKVSYEEKEITVGETLRWLDKLEKVTSKGAKLAMVSMLLRRFRKDTLEEAERRIGKLPTVFDSADDGVFSKKDVLSLISGMKGGKE